MAEHSFIHAPTCVGVVNAQGYRNLQCMVRIIICVSKIVKYLENEAIKLQPVFHYAEFCVRTGNFLWLFWLIPPEKSQDKGNFRLVENRLKIVWQSNGQFEFSLQRNHKKLCKISLHEHFKFSLRNKDI